VKPAYVTAPGTGVPEPPCFKTNEAGLSVIGFIPSLKVAEIALLIGTPVRPLAGKVELTKGAVVSGTKPVVKVHILLDTIALPARSLTPVVIRAVKAVLAARVAFGVKVAVTPIKDTTPATGVTPWNKPNVAVVIVKGSIASLKVAVIALLIATPVAPLTGTV